MTAARLPAVLALAAFMAVSMIATAGSARAETLVTGLSAETVSIQSTFTGSQILLFGTIERDAQTVARPDPYDIVVVVRGPDSHVVARRKQRLGGIWVNADAREFVDFPSYLAVISSRPVADMATSALLTHHQIGLSHLTLTEPAAAAGPDADRELFKRAAIRLQQDRDLFIEAPEGVRFLSESLFEARIPLPATVPVGIYETTVYLLRGGALLGHTEARILVRKSGFEQFIYALAHERPVIYGLGAALIALFGGWMAGVIFRR